MFNSFCGHYYIGSMRFHLLLFVAIYFAYNAEYIEGVFLKFTNFVCNNYNTSWVRVQKCRLKAVKRNHVTLNFNATLLQPVDHVHLQIELLKNSNGYKLFHYNATIDACRFIKKSFDPVAIFIFRMFREYSNFNHSCPYTGDIIIKDLHLSSKLLPMPIPTGDYMLAFTWLIDKIRILGTNQYFTFVEDE